MRSTRSSAASSSATPRSRLSSASRPPGGARLPSGRRCPAGAALVRRHVGQLGRRAHLDHPQQPSGSHARGRTATGAFQRDLAAYHPKIQALMKVDDKQRGVGLDHDEHRDLLERHPVQPDAGAPAHGGARQVDLERRAGRRAPGDEEAGAPVRVLRPERGGQTGYWSLVFANGGKVTNDEGSSFAPLLENPAVEADPVAHRHRRPARRLAAAERHGGGDRIDQRGHAVPARQARHDDRRQLAGERATSPRTCPSSGTWRTYRSRPARASARRCCTAPGSGSTRPARRSTRRCCSPSTWRRGRRTRSTAPPASSSPPAWTSGTRSTPAPSRPRAGRCSRRRWTTRTQHPLTGQWGIITYDATDPIEAALTKVFAGSVAVREGLQDGVTQANQELAKRVAEVKAAGRS